MTKRSAGEDWRFWAQIRWRTWTARLGTGDALSGASTQPTADGNSASVRAYRATLKSRYIG